MSGLPHGWASTTLGETCEVVGGSTPRSTVPEYWGGEIAWITPNDLSGYTAKSIARGERSISLAGYESCSTRLLPPGAVLFSSRAPIGYVAVVAEPLCTNQGFKSFVPPDGLDTDYLYWYLRAAVPWICELGSGTTFREISKRTAESIFLPLAPKKEQRRIVDAIEEQLSRLEAAEAAMRRARQKLDRLRDSTIQTGTDTDGPVIEIGELASVISGPAFPSASFRSPPDGIRLLRGENIEPGALRWKQVRTWPDELVSGYEHLFVEEGDLILAMDRPVISGGLKLAAVHGPDVPALLVQRVARIRPGPEVLPSFLHLSLRRSEFVPHVLAGQTGTQLPHITLNGIRSHRIAVPSLDAQTKIVANLEQALSLVDAQQRSIDRALERSAALRRSILESAFTGRLVRQDPNDEPADVLLERIRSERPLRKKSRRAAKSAV